MQPGDHTPNYTSLTDVTIERSTADVAPPARPQQQQYQQPQPQQRQPWGQDRYSDDRYHGGSHDQRHYKKRKSWLEEIFD